MKARFAVGVAAAVALAAGVAAQEVSRDPNDPPSGTAADQQLWRDLRSATNDAMTSMARVSQCSYRIAYGGYYQWLDEAAKGEGEGAAGARGLRARLEDAARRADALKPPPRPSVHECRMVLVDLEGKMPENASPSMRGELAETRAQARGCVKALQPFAAAMTERADALEAALAAVDERRNAARTTPPSVPPGGGRQ